MAPNPITYLELEAFERKALVRFTAWETDLLMRVDDAVLAAIAGEKPITASTKSEPVPASDPKGVKALLRGIATQKRVQAEAKSRPAPKPKP